MTKIENFIKIMLIIIICLAVITLVYINIPNETDDEDIISEDVILTVTFNDQKYEYSLSDLELIEEYTGSGSYIKSKALDEGNIIINGPFNFTGVKFSTLFDLIENLPNTYNITVTAVDNWTNQFTQDHVNGIIDVYNETGNITGNSGATMVLAYKENEEYILDDGPTRVVFLGENVITLSSNWAKMVATIDISET